AGKESACRVRSVNEFTDPDPSEEPVRRNAGRVFVAGERELISGLSESRLDDPRRRCRVGELVRVEIEQAIATIRLDRPPMNALNAQVQAEIADAARQVSGDDQVRAVV